MKTKDIEPGRFYRVRLQRVGGIVPTDLMRVERIDEPSYEGDKAIVVASRFMAKGVVETRHAPRDIIAQEDPDEKTRRIMAVIEEG